MESAPTFEPVSLAEIKQWLNIDGGQDDAVVASLIAMSIDSLQRSLGHRLADREVVIEFDQFSNFLKLPVSPVSAITSVTYLDSQGTRQTVDPVTYRSKLNTLIPHVKAERWPSGSQIEVTVRAGYTSAETVPATLKHAVAVMVADHYLNREGEGTSARTVEALVKTFRNGWLA